MSDSDHPRHGRLRARRTAARRRLHQAQHQRESLSASPRVFEALREALTGDRLRKYPDPLGTAFRQAAGRVLGRRSRRHPHRQRLRRRADDPDAGLRSRGRPGGVADAELPALPHAGRAARRPLPDGSVHGRLGPAVALAGARRPPDLRVQPQLAVRLGACRRPSLERLADEVERPAGARRGLCRFRRRPRPAPGPARPT